YRFRYANPDGIRTFSQEHAGTHTYDLPQCRRCPPNIVEISNALIGHDARSAARPLLQPNEGLGKAEVHIVQHATLGEEVETVSDYIMWYLEKHDVPPGQVLVLTPRRFIGNAVRDGLIKRGLNSLSFFLEDQLDTESAAEGFCLLTLLVNPSDRTAFRAWLSLRSAGGLVGSYRKLRAAAQAAQK